MAILDLPTELLVQIIGLTEHDDLENICRSCKTIYAAGKDQLAEHRRYQRTWKHLPANAPGLQGTEIEVILALLSCVAIDPRIAGYIETLSLRRGSPMWAQTDMPHEMSHPKPDKNAINRLVKESSVNCPSDWDLDGPWKTDGESSWTEFPSWGNPVVWTILLLSRLPNIRTLTLPLRWGDEEYSSVSVSEQRDVVQQIVAEANDDSIAGGPLAKLETILPYCGAQYDERNGLTELGPFMSLQSLKELYACNMVGVDDHYTGIPFNWLAGAADSCLRKIVLAGACIDAEGITELVKHTPQLTDLTYSHHTKWHGCQHDWDAGAFVEAIGAHRGDIITNLAVTIDCLFGNIEHGVTTLKVFQKLQTVELDLRLFAGPATDSGHKQGMDGHFADFQEKDVPSLLTMLPPSVNRLDLHISEDWGDDGNKEPGLVLVSLLDGVIPDNADFQLLVRSAGYWRGWPKSLVRDIERQYPEWVDKSQLSTKLPLWKDEFVARFGKELFE